MGDARVQYQLERTLPGLQLAAQHGIFDRDTELRAITQRRRQFEGALVRRHALVSDYIAYIQYEDDLEKLRLLRLTRLRQIDDVPRQDVAKMHSEATHHMVSIFERGVQRCKYNANLWQLYMAWAQRRKMRTAVSRIAARALALFPNNIALWLTVADEELNGNMSTSTARALLQRALRLNAIAHKDQVYAQQVEAEHARPFKRARRKGGTASHVPAREIAIRQSSSKAANEPTLVLADQECELVRLWIEYIRMELVFIERLRRRRAVLNILDDDLVTPKDGDGHTKVKAQGLSEDDVEPESVPATTNGEEAPPALSQLAQSVDSPQEAPESGSVLHGSIPIAAMTSAISLDSASCLPPNTHFAFLLGIARLFRTFPFLGNAEKIRSRLANAVVEALDARFAGEATASLIGCAFPALDSIQASILQSNIEANPEQEADESSLLRSASKLSRKSNNELDNVLYSESELVDIRGASQTLSAVLGIIYNDLALEGSPVQVAMYTRDILTRLRKRGQDASLNQYPSHLAAQIHSMAIFEHLSESVGEEFEQFIAAWKKRLLREASALEHQSLDVFCAQLSAIVRDMRRDKVEAKTDRSQMISELEQLLDKGFGRIKTQSACEALASLMGEAISALFVFKAANVESGLERKKEHMASEQESRQSWKTIEPLISASNKSWTRLQSVLAIRQNSALWNMYVAWLTSLPGPRPQVAAFARAQIERAIGTTVGAADAHETLLCAFYNLLRESTNVSIRNDPMRWIASHAFPRPSFWRFVAQTESRLFSQTSRDESRRAHFDYAKAAFDHLLQSTTASGLDADALAGDTSDYLDFLCITAARHGLDSNIQTALSILRRSLDLLSKVPDARARLEQDWRAISARMRELSEGEEHESGSETQE